MRLGTQSIVLEAAEVDENGYLFFYGRETKEQTIAGQPLSLADIAVVYRSVFHYGYNEPYISLDKNEDNRYAKVNFGGHFENTHVGHVVLEADKLFKTLSTGIDPNTHKKSRTIKSTRISGFNTEDERSLLGGNHEGHEQIRYWFYPDSIGTVTDGSIGVIDNFKFKADVERIDAKKSVSDATNRTIRHLNQNYFNYARADRIYRELNTVGRLMALMIWLKDMNFKERVELDDFLSIILPAFKTPVTTKKMLAVTSANYIKTSPPNESNIHQIAHAQYLSHLLDKYPSTTPDEEFLKIAENADLHSMDFTPPAYKKLYSLALEYQKIIKANQKDIASLEVQIEQMKNKLNQSNDNQIDKINSLIDQYNIHAAIDESYLQLYNSVVEELDKMEIATSVIVSIGGGIGMRPKDFKKIIWKPASERILEVKAAKRTMRSEGKMYISGAWMRNKVSHRNIRRNILPKLVWIPTKTTGVNEMYSYHTKKGNVAKVIMPKKGNTYQSKVSVNGASSEIKYSNITKTLIVNHSGFSNNFNGQVLRTGKYFEFFK